VRLALHELAPGAPGRATLSPGAPESERGGPNLSPARPSPRRPGRDPWRAHASTAPAACVSLPRCKRIVGTRPEARAWPSPVTWRAARAGPDPGAARPRSDFRRTAGLVSGIPSARPCARRWLHHGTKPLRRRRRPSPLGAALTAGHVRGALAPARGGRAGGRRSRRPSARERGRPPVTGRAVARRCSRHGARRFRSPDATSTPAIAATRVADATAPVPSRRRPGSSRPEEQSNAMVQRHAPPRMARSCG